MHDLFNADHLHDKVEASLHQKNQMLVKLYNRRPIDVDQTTEELLKLGERLKPYVANTGLILNKALDEGKTVLFEGAQATMLDVDHGTYRSSLLPTRPPAAPAPAPAWAPPRSPA